MPWGFQGCLRQQKVVYQGHHISLKSFFFTKTVLVQIIFNLNQCHMRNAQVGHYLEGDMKIFMDKEARIY